jgi:hypothetical protein
MPIKATIIDGLGTGIFNGVTSVGECLIAGFGDLKNLSSYQNMTTTGAYNFYKPIIGQQFIITSVVFSGDANSTITIYEAANKSTLIADKIVFQINLRTNTTVVIPLPFGGFLPVSEGEYLNAFTDNTIVSMNIVGYYQPITRIT